MSIIIFALRVVSKFGLICAQRLPQIACRFPNRATIDASKSLSKQTCLNANQHWEIIDNLPSVIRILSQWKMRDQMHVKKRGDMSFSASLISMVVEKFQLGPHPSSRRNLTNTYKYALISYRSPMKKALGMVLKLHDDCNGWYGSMYTDGSDT